MVVPKTTDTTIYTSDPTMKRSSLTTITIGDEFFHLEFSFPFNYSLPVSATQRAAHFN